VIAVGRGEEREECLVVDVKALAIFTATTTGKGLTRYNICTATVNK
jgi:hypothetical protein